MAAHQAPPSLGFSRQEYWSRLPFPSPYVGLKGHKEWGVTEHSHTHIHRYACWCTYVCMYIYILIVLVYSDCCNKYSHRLGGLRTREIYFSQFWGLEILDQGASMVRFWRGPSSHSLTSYTLHCVKRLRALAQVSFIRAFIPFIWAPLLWPNHLPKTPTS